jgi:putative Mg2+ transporter-C (MgtC) family protein
MLASNFDSLSGWLQPEIDYVVRVMAALLLGGLIGLERELGDKPAGFRTIILICVGACVFTILSEAVGGPDWNTTRIAAQVVTGIGFLGGGVILRDRAGVKGLTTAATIWAVAAIGMGAGFGEFSLAVFGTVVILVALLVLDAVEHWIGRWRDLQDYHIVAHNTEDTFERVSATFTDAKLRIRKRTCYEDGDSLVFHIRAMGGKANHEQLRIKLARSEEYTLRKSL